jgi:hypothetical protein
MQLCYGCCESLVLCSCYRASVVDHVMRHRELGESRYLKWLCESLRNAIDAQYYCRKTDARSVARSGAVYHAARRDTIPQFFKCLLNPLPHHLASEPDPSRRHRPSALT